MRLRVRDFFVFRLSASTAAERPGPATLAVRQRLTARPGRPIVAHSYWSPRAFPSPGMEGLPMPPGEPFTSSPPHAQSAHGPAATPASAGSACDDADVTGLLIAWNQGDRAALDALLRVVYAELRRQARRALRREAAGHTLQPTALVHEAYLRLVDQRPIQWQSRAHFFRIAARCMRQVLVDAARSRRAAKRGRGWALAGLCCRRGAAKGRGHRCRRHAAGSARSTDWSLLALQ